MRKLTFWFPTWSDTNQAVQLQKMARCLKFRIKKVSTAAFTYYYDPAILRNKLTPLSIFRDLALRERDSNKLIVYFYVFYRVYTNIPE